MNKRVRIRPTVRDIMEIPLTRSFPCDSGYKNLNVLSEIKRKLFKGVTKKI